ncbi:MAG: hypothetical protein L3J74_01895 [Bacteroidales bacterium]|nr:hypothetical protein [Bacteroidales bacterium]
MKTSIKIIKSLFVVFLITLISCNKDKVNPDGSVCLLTRITKPEGETGGTISYIIEYNENKKPIRYYEAENTNNYTSINYVDNQIDNVIKYQNGTLSAKYTYDWTSDSVSILVQNFYKAAYFEKIVYQLDENGLPKIGQWYWQNTDGTWQKAYHFVYQWENNNLVQSEYWLTDKVYTKIFEYDDKFNVYESLSWFYGIETLSKNNIVKETITYNQGGTPDVTEYSYQYNEKGYPYSLSKKYSNNSTEEISFEYFCN